MARPYPRVVLVTDLTAVPRAELDRRLGAVARLDAAARAGAWVLLRDKEMDPEARAALARDLRATMTAIGAGLVVAADVDLAARVGADGVHLPSGAVDRIGPARVACPGWVSIACHAVADCVAAAAAGATAVVLSPIFASPGKGPPLGVEALAAARSALARDVTLVALGGVEAATAGACFRAGADAVAAIRAEPVDLLLAR